MTPFRAANRKVWKTRITLEDGRTGIFSCGTDDLATARQVVNAVKALKRRRIWAPLEAVLEKKASRQSATGLDMSRQQNATQSATPDPRDSISLRLAVEAHWWCL